MDNVIPDSWIHATLDDIVIENNNAIKRGPFGSSIRKEFFVPKGYKVYEQKNVIYNDFNLGNYYINEKKFQELEDFELKSGDIIISCSGTIGKIAIAPENLLKGIINQALLKISLNDSIINKKYFLYLFNSDAFKKKITTRGSAMLNLTSVKDLKKILIPIPPFDEQTRIVSKLEELFTKLDAGIEYLKKTRILLKQYRQSVLKHAFEGKLTEKWRELHKNELKPVSSLLGKIFDERKGNKKRNKADFTLLPLLSEFWSWTTIEDLAEDSNNAIKAGPFGSSLKKESYSSKGYKIYGQEQVIKGNPYYGDYYIDKKHYEILKSCSVKPNDVLISLVGTIGKSIVLPEDIEPGIINPRLVKISFDKRLINPLFFKHYLDSNSVRELFSIVSHGGTMKILNLRILKELPIPLPPLIEQMEILKEVDLLFSIMNHLEIILKSSLLQCIKLRESILKCAFEGKLVHQDPNDESRETILEKIKSESTIPIKKEKSKITKRKSIDINKQMRLM